MKYLSIAALLVVQASFAMGDESAKELVEKAVARDEQVFSGRIKWTQEFEGPHFGPRPPTVPPSRFQSFFKDEWAEGGKCFGGVDEWGHPMRGWSNGKVLPKSLENSIGAYRAGDLDDLKREGNVTVYLPRWAGGFFNRKLKRWAKQFPGQFEFVADDKVDGIAVKMVEAETRDEAPFGRNSPGGKIRLFIAPQLGYVIPRAEERTFDGTLVVRYEAIDFSEKSPGIWFPKLVQKVRGDVKHFVTFLDVQMLNQEIPASDFCVETIEDGRPKGE